MVEKRQPTEGWWEENEIIILPYLPGPRGRLNETMDADHRARHIVQTSKLAIFIATSLSVL